jgi:hypothetical protein
MLSGVAMAKPVVCTHSGLTSPGGNTVNFSYQDCGGVLPDSDAVGTAATIQINGGNSGFAVSQPATGAASGIWFYANVGNASYTVSVVYVR